MNLKLEIISPEGIIFNGECHMAVVPSVLGDIGFMYNHEMVISLLREGEIKIFDDKNEVIKSLSVTSGAAEMQENGKLLVLVN